MPIIASGQFKKTGKWEPNGIDASWPRTLINTSEVEIVRNIILTQDFEKNIFSILYKGILNDAFRNIKSKPSHQEIDDGAYGAKARAFVLLINLKINSAQNGYEILTTTERQTLTKEIINLITSYPFSGYTSKDLFQYRSKELMLFLEAFDLLKGADAIGNTVNPYQATKKKTAKEVYDEKIEKAKQHLVDVVQVYYDFYKLFALPFPDNIGLMSSAALGMAAIVLNDTESNIHHNKRAENWIGSAMYHIENSLWLANSRLSEKGKVAGYAEGPWYFRYGFEAVIPFFHALGNFIPNEKNLGNFIHKVYLYKILPVSLTVQNVDNPWLDQNNNYQNLYDWYIKILTPNGSNAVYDDTKSNRFFDGLSILEKPKYSIFSAHLNEGSPFMDLRADYICAQNHFPDYWRNELDTLYSNPNSGNLIFRSNTGSEALYMHVLAEQGTAINSQSYALGHEHADATSFSIYGGDKMLALDPPYWDYNERQQVNKDQHHNLILVGEPGGFYTEGPKPDTPGKISSSFSTVKLDYGEVSASYGAKGFNATNTRKTLFLRDKYFIVADFLEADGIRSYVWQFHGNGSESNGTFNKTAQHTFPGIYARGIWNYPAPWVLDVQNTGMGEFISYSSGDLFKHGSNTDEIVNGNSGLHSTMSALVLEAKDFIFLSALTPYNSNNNTAPVYVSKSQPNFAAQIIDQDDEHLDFVIAQLNTSVLSLVDPFDLGTTDQFETDGKIALLSIGKNEVLDNAFVNTTFRQAFIKNGTKLFYNGNAYIESASGNDIDVTYQLIDQFRYNGYANTSRATGNTSISFYFPSYAGEQIAPIAYDMQNNVITTGSDYDIATNVLTITFSPGTHYFFIKPCFFPSASFTIPTVNCLGEPILLNGSSSEYEDSYEIRVCRVNQCEDIYFLISGTGQLGTINLTEFAPPYFLQDGADYSATLSVLNPCHSIPSKLSQTFSIINNPSVSSLGNDIDICLGQSVTLNAQDADVIHYRWYRGAGSPIIWKFIKSGANSYQLTDAPASTSKYVVIMEFANGCRTTDTLKVNIIGTLNVNATFTINPNPAIDLCPGTTVTLNGNKSIYDQFRWEIKDLINCKYCPPRVIQDWTSNPAYLKQTLNLAASHYEVILKTRSNCGTASQSSSQVTFNPVFRELSLIAQTTNKNCDIQICANAIINGTFYYYTWYRRLTQSGSYAFITNSQTDCITVHPEESTVYKVEVFAKPSCRNSKNISVVVDDACHCAPPDGQCLTSNNGGGGGGGEKQGCAASGGDKEKLVGGPNGHVFHQSFQLANTEKVFEGDIRVAKNATLRIENSIIYLRECSRIVVEGRMEVINSQLKGCENARWKGVEVRGDRNKEQTPGNQGTMLIEGSVIADAEIGILLGQRNGQTFDMNSGGGILEMRNGTIMERNKIHVKALPFEKNNHSHIEFTEFRELFKGGASQCVLISAPRHIHMEKINGIRIHNNTFMGEDLGIHLQENKNFSIKENYFNETKVAIKTENSPLSDMGSDISDNHFITSQNAIEFNNDNHLMLKVYCNEFWGYSDHGVLSTNTQLADQGTIQKGAGNSYTSVSTQTNHSWAHQGNTMNYFHDPSNPINLTTGNGYTANALAAQQDNTCGALAKTSNIGSAIINNEETEKDELDSTGDFGQYQLSIYPNPFNHQTNIIYTLIQQQEVTLYITNIHGQVIDKLIDHQKQEAGCYKLTYNATHLAPGIYYYTLQAGGVYIETKKMGVLR